MTYVEYENFPGYYRHCSTAGHDLSRYKFMNKEEPQLNNGRQAPQVLRNENQNTVGRRRYAQQQTVNEKASRLEQDGGEYLYNAAVNFSVV